MADEGGSDPSAPMDYEAYGTADMNASAYGFGACGYGVAGGQEIDIRMFIRTYIFPVVLFMGLLWNPLTAAALYHIGVHKWSTVFYLSLLSVVDLLILLIKAGDAWYSEIRGESLSVKIMDASDALCKTYLFVFMFLKHMSPWLMVALAMELTISTVRPRKTYVICTMERARNVIMLLVILIFSLDINYFWTWGVPRLGYGCRYTEEFSLEFRDTIWPMLDNTVEHYLPLIFVSVCFFVTVSTMISRKSRDEQSIEEELSKYFMELKTLKDFQVICLIMCLIFMCLTLFKVARNIVDFMIVRNHIILDCEGQAKYFPTTLLVKTFEDVFTFIFYTMKWIPCFVISTKFRKTLQDGCKWCERAIYRLANTLTGTNQRRKPWETKMGSFSSGVGSNGGGANGGCSGVGSGRDLDGACGQQLKPLVNNSNSSYSHRAMDRVDDDLPLEDNGEIYGRGAGGRRQNGGNGCGNSLAVAATVENHSENSTMDDSRTSFLSTGTDV